MVWVLYWFLELYYTFWARKMLLHYVQSRTTAHIQPCKDVASIGVVRNLKYSLVRSEGYRYAWLATMPSPRTCQIPNTRKTASFPFYYVAWPRGGCTAKLHADRSQFRVNNAVHPMLRCFETHPAITTFQNCLQFLCASSVSTTNQS